MEWQREEVALPIEIRKLLHRRSRVAPAEAHPALQSFQPCLEVGVFDSQGVYFPVLFQDAFFLLHTPLLQCLRGYYQDSVQITRRDGGRRPNGSDGTVAKKNVSARILLDLRVPPNNRLEALRGDRAGQHSLRINDQWRICFRWQGGDAHDVEIVDYH